MILLIYKHCKKYFGERKISSNKSAFVSSRMGKSGISLKNELFCLEIKMFVLKTLWTVSLKSSLGLNILSSANISMQNFHTPRDLRRGVWSHLNICNYNLQRSCTEKEISGLIRHCTQILVFLYIFDNHC